MICVPGTILAASVWSAVFFVGEEVLPRSERTRSRSFFSPLSGTVPAKAGRRARKYAGFRINPLSKIHRIRRSRRDPYTDPPFERAYLNPARRKALLIQLRSAKGLAQDTHTHTGKRQMGCTCGVVGHGPFPGPASVLSSRDFSGTRAGCPRPTALRRAVLFPPAASTHQEPRHQAASRQGLMPSATRKSLKG